MARSSDRSVGSLSGNMTTYGNMRGRARRFAAPGLVAAICLTVCLIMTSIAAPARADVLDTHSLVRLLHLSGLRHYVDNWVHVVFDQHLREELHRKDASHVDTRLVAARLNEAQDLAFDETVSVFADNLTDAEVGSALAFLTSGRLPPMTRLSPQMLNELYNIDHPLQARSILEKYFVPENAEAVMDFLRTRAGLKLYREARSHAWHVMNDVQEDIEDLAEAAADGDAHSMRR